MTYTLLQNNSNTQSKQQAPIREDNSAIFDNVGTSTLLIFVSNTSVNELLPTNHSHTTSWKPNILFSYNSQRMLLVGWNGFNMTSYIGNHDCLLNFNIKWCVILLIIIYKSSNVVKQLNSVNDWLLSALLEWPPSTVFLLRKWYFCVEFELLQSCANITSCSKKEMLTNAPFNQNVHWILLKKRIFTFCRAVKAQQCCGYIL